MIVAGMVEGNIMVEIGKDRQEIKIGEMGRHQIEQTPQAHPNFMACNITVGQEDAHDPRPQVIDMLQLGKLVLRAGKHERVTAALTVVCQPAQVIAKEAEGTTIHHKRTPIHLDKTLRRR